MIKAGAFCKTTGDVWLAGTDANVDITLYGDRANSDETKLDTPGHDDFERGNKEDESFLPRRKRKLHYANGTTHS